MTTALVGLDVGTSALKGLAIDPAGTVLARAEAEYDAQTPRAGWSEQDPDVWWEAGRAVLARLRNEVGLPAGIGLSGQMHGLVTLDRRARPLRPAILWNDGRGAHEGATLEREMGIERLTALTGNRALPGFTAPSLLWLRHAEPDAYAQIDHVMLPKDYVRLQLCGELATDVSDASGTLMFDVAHRCWSEQMLTQWLDVDPDWLPPALESPSLSGITTDGVPVAAGAGDQAAGAVGVGIDEAGDVSVVIGTSGVVFGVLERFGADPAGRVHAFCHAVPDTWHGMGVMLSAGGALAWLRRALGAGAPFGQLMSEAAEWPPGADGLVFLPYLAGERTPHADPDARGAFIGLQLHHNRGALVRAVLEGIAFGLRDSLDLLREVGVAPKVGRVSGGGARSQLWLQIIASALELPLQQVAVQEGAAFGAALLGGVAAGTWSDVRAAAAATVKPGSLTEPVAEWIEPLREQRARYQGLYPALRELRPVA